jgi:NADH-quinone oxidoreductase subunit M
MYTLLAGTAIIVGAIYMLTAYKKAFFGQVTNEENEKLKDINRTELLGLVPLVIVAIWLGVYPKPVLEPINNSVESVIQLMHDKAQSAEAKARIPDLSDAGTMNSQQEAH